MKYISFVSCASCDEHGEYCHDWSKRIYVKVSSDSKQRAEEQCSHGCHCSHYGSHCDSSYERSNASLALAALNMVAYSPFNPLPTLQRDILVKTEGHQMSLSCFDGRNCKATAGFVGLPNKWASTYFGRVRPLALAQTAYPEVTSASAATGSKKPSGPGTASPIALIAFSFASPPLTVTCMCRHRTPLFMCV